MGNCFGRPSKGSDNFQSPGRTLGNPPAPSSGIGPAQVAAGTAKPASQVGGPGRTVGGAASSAEGDAKAAAARAAEERAARASASSKGKLGQNLAAQKAQTTNTTLQAHAEEERRKRDLAQGQEARNWN